MAQTPQAPALSEVETLKVSEELMARRLKNRERQRRYRAKKRLEADIRKSYMNLQQQLPMCPVQAQPSEPVDASRSVPDVGFPTRVYSGRKWKKEARMVHLKKPKEVETNVVQALDTEKETNAVQTLDTEKETNVQAFDKEQETNVEAVEEEKETHVEEADKEKAVPSVDCGTDCNKDEMNNVEMIP